MSRFHAAVVVLCSALSACGGCAPSPPAPAKPPTSAVATGTTTPPPPAKTPDEQLAEHKAMWNEVSHGLIASFQSRVYDPRRDGMLDHAEGVVDVRRDGKNAKYRFVFDAANPANEPVKVETVSEDAGIDGKDTAMRVRQWAILACCGPYANVVFFLPPTPLVLVPPQDPASKNKIVWAQPFHSALNVSYSFDERQVVTARGEWTDDKHKAVTNFEWEFWHGRYLLRNAALYQGPTTQFDYDDRRGVNLLSAVHVGADKSFEAVLTFDVVRRRPK